TPVGPLLMTAVKDDVVAHGGIVAHRRATDLLDSMLHVLVSFSGWAEVVRRVPAYRERLELFAGGDELGPGRLVAERGLHRVAHGVIDKEGVRARQVGDIAVRAMHQVAVEDQHRTRGASGIDQT